MKPAEVDTIYYSRPHSESFVQQTIDPNGEIAIRAEKLRFLTDELALASELCASAANAGMARMIARHVTVRTADFIDHARQLRNGLPASAGAKGFKDTVNVLNDEFQANLALARHKLGAHVQDMDFVERLNLWVAIDAGKVAYFAEGARELWDRLGALASRDTSRSRPHPRSPIPL